MSPGAAPTSNARERQTPETCADYLVPEDYSFLRLSALIPTPQAGLPGAMGWPAQDFN